MDYSEALVGSSEPETVRVQRRDVREYVGRLPKDRKGRPVFTYDQAVGLQKLQFGLQQATTLTLIDCQRHVVSRHGRPDHYLKAPPLAALRFDDDASSI